MVAPDLTVPRAALAAGVVLGATLLGGVLAVIDPALAGPVAPHPTLSSRPSEAASILANNALALAAPFGLVALGAGRRALSRRASDLVVAVVIADNTLPVGIALGHWRTALLPYVPQLPLEWAALSSAVGAWLHARDGYADQRELVRLAAVALVLLTAAAGVETWATPHRAMRAARAGIDRVDTARDRASRVGAGGCGRHGFCTGDGHVAARSRAPFPSGRSVPLGRLAGADRAPSTHRPPPGGIT